MKNSSSSHEVEALIQAYLEGSLTESEAARLLTHLQQNPKLAVEVVDDLRFDCLIRAVLAEDGAVQNPSLSAKLIPAAFSKAEPARLAPGPEVGWKWAWPLALAASIILLVSLGFWFLGPTMGEPVLAEIQGDGVAVERATTLVQVTTGMRLQPGDIIRAGPRGFVTIRFDPELTQIRLSPESELQLTAFRSRKQLAFRTGRLEAAVARQRPFCPMRISTPNAEARVLGTEFSLSATPESTRLEVAKGQVRLMRNKDGKFVDVPAGHRAEVADGTELAALPATGRILREYWTNLANNTLFPHGTVLTTKRSVVAPPDGFDYLPRFQSAPLGPGLRFTERIRGYVHPPKTGQYRFAVTQAHVSVSLHLSRTDKPEDVAQVTYWMSNHVAGVDNVTPVPLQAGRKYYIEIIHESDGGDDQLTVMWRAPGREPEIIPGEFLSPFPTNQKKGK